MAKRLLLTYLLEERLVPISPSLGKILLKYKQKRWQYVKERYEVEYYFLSQKGK